MAVVGQGFCGYAKRPTQNERRLGLARLGGGASRVPRATRSADKRVYAMDLDSCDRATRLPIDCGSHRAGHGEINTSDCSFNCTRISVTRPGSGLEQMNFQHGRTK
jgi:hypothetical protein